MFTPINKYEYGFTELHARRQARVLAILGLTTALIFAFHPGISRASDIKAGVAKTVDKKVFGILRGDQQLLSVGSEVFMDQVVRTDDESSTQLQLLDRTDISIGSKSEIVLDRFIFDPDRPKGDVVLYATKGVFRFVTGTQDSSSYHIKTPLATIGVRGTIIEFNLQKDLFELLLIKGRAVAHNIAKDADVSMDEESTLLTINANGESSTRPWTGRLSLYQARGGDVTGSTGTGAGGGGGGQILGTTSVPFTGTPPFTRTGGGLINPPPPLPNFTFSTTAKITTTAAPVSP